MSSSSDRPPPPISPHSVSPKLDNGAVSIEGDNYGTINTGTQIVHSDARRQVLRQAYLAQLHAEANQLPLFAAESAGAQITLSSVYTALLTSRTEADAFAVNSRAERSRHRSALDVLNGEHRLVLLGGPGSGKSTFLSFVAMSLAGEMLGTVPNLETLRAPLPPVAGEKEQPPQCWDHGPLLPVRVVLRDFAAQLPAPGATITASLLWRFIEGQAHAEFAAHLQVELHTQGALVLLDGLDEVPEANQRREQVKQAVQGFAAAYPRCRLAVTSRTYAYQQQDWKLDGFAEAQLLPFTAEQIHTFVDTWYAHMVRLHRLSQAEAVARAARLKQLAGQNERLRELAERPLLLTLIAKLQMERGGELPEKREELYHHTVDMLLSEWEQLKPRGRNQDGTPHYEPSLSEFLQTGRDAIRRQLNRLAFEAHRDQQDLRGTADIPQATLIDALLNANPKRRADVRVGLLEDYLRDRSGLMVAHGVGLYQFPHRSFQEYLAACHLTDNGFPRRLAELTREAANRWREVALLAGAKAARDAPDRDATGKVWRLAEALCPRARSEGEVPLPAQWGALLAGELLVQSVDLDAVEDFDADKVERIRHWQVWLLECGTLPAVERALAGRTLAALEDPRREVMRLDHMQFCFVPPGVFVMGSDGHFDEEKPQHRVELAYPYFIARFPVSVAQWHEYLQQTGRAHEEPRSLPGRDNDPVVEVSWHEALRFCGDLTQRWGSHLPCGWRVTLPSEPEWEKAARGGERVSAPALPCELREVASCLAAGHEFAPNRAPTRDYPWEGSFDSEHANADMSIGEINALGCFGARRSPYGCEELSGNVWEWTRSLWGKYRQPDFKYPYAPNDPTREDLSASDRTLRVLRGGSFVSVARLARCACRRWGPPIVRDLSFGFRVVLRGPPVA